MHRIFVLFCVLLFCVYAPCGEAAGAPSGGSSGKEAGWHGSIALGGGGFFGRTSQMDAWNEDRDLQNLKGKGSHFSRAIPYARLDLGYTFAENGTRIYLSNKESQGGSAALGMERNISGLGEIAVEGSFKWDREWKDPYQTDSKRKTTNTWTLGGKLRWKDVMGSNMRFSYSLARKWVEEDSCGQRDSDLRREAYIHELELGYKTFVPSLGPVEPFAVLGYNGAKGRSNRYIEYGGGLKHIFFWQDCLFTTKVSFQKRDYRYNHPDFTSSRQEDVFGASESIIFKTPFDLDDVSIIIRLAHYRVQARQDFFASRMNILGTGISYSF